MKTYNINYKIKYQDKTKYVILSDFHGYFDIKLANYINNINSDYIIITGDLLNGTNWNKTKYVNKVKAFINIIGTNHKVIISLGNHDLWGIKDIGFKNFKSLKSTNVYPIYNETCIINNHAFTSFVPDNNCYNYFKQDDYKTIENILKTPINIPDNKYIKHLISHNPYHFYHNEVMHEIGNHFDMIFVGHLHDGYIPTKYLVNNYHKLIDKGFQEICFKHHNKTHLKHKRILCRGVAYIEDQKYNVLLPNNQIYCYEKTNHYYLSDRKAISPKIPPLIIAGAINTCLNIKLFYPCIIKLENGNMSASYTINNI